MEEVRTVNLVAQDQEGRPRQILHGEQSVKLILALGETFGILGVDEEDNAGYLGEVLPARVSLVP